MLLECPQPQPSRQMQAQYRGLKNTMPADFKENRSFLRGISVSAYSPVQTPHPHSCHTWPPDSRLSRFQNHKPGNFFIHSATDTQDGEEQYKPCPSVCTHTWEQTCMYGGQRAKFRCHSSGAIQLADLGTQGLSLNLEPDSLSRQAAQ